MKRVSISPIILMHGYPKLKDIQKLVDEGRGEAKMVAKRLKHARLKDLRIYCGAPSKLFHPDRKICRKDWSRKILDYYGGNFYFWIDEVIEPLMRLKYVRNVKFGDRKPSLEMRERLTKLSQIPDEVQGDSGDDSDDADGVREPGRGYSWEKDGSDDERPGEKAGGEGGDAGELDDDDESVEDDESEEEEDSDEEDGDENLEGDECDETAGEDADAHDEGSSED